MAEGDAACRKMKILVLFRLRMGFPVLAPKIDPRGSP